jgi:hypothetical protein
MQIAKKLLDEKNIKGFYDEAMRTLYEYTGLKLGLPVSDFTKENIRKIMEQKNVNTETINQFVQIIESCEMAHFGATSAGNENEIYNKSIQLIETLEEKMG